MIINYKVEQQTLTRINSREVPRKGSREYLYLQFSFSSDWDDLVKTVFISNGDYSDGILVEEDTPVQVPIYYTQNASFSITFVGINGGQVVPTNVITLLLEESNEIWEEVAPDPNSIPYQQLINMVQSSGGVDGFSPTVEVTEIEGGHTVNITDKNGEHSFNVMDGLSLPTATSADAGKVLMVDGNGNYVLGTVGGSVTPEEPEEPTAPTLTSISAVYTQGSAVIYPSDSLNTLKSSLVVTAHYSDNSTQTVSALNYSLSGTLAVGTSTVTVTYSGKTTTFNVTVSQEIQAEYNITYDFNNSLNNAVAQSSNTASIINHGESYAATLSAISPAELSGVTIKMGNTDITDDVFDRDTGEINISSVTGNLSIKATNDVDIGLFMGQSNMSGRGTALTATVCPEGKGFWYKQNFYSPGLDYSSSEGLYPIVEPFGNENPASTGSMVSALCLSYFNNTGVPIVAISNSYGGTSINNWQDISDGTVMHKGITKFNNCLNYMETTGYNVRNKFMVWCQGETDGTGSSDTIIDITNMSTAEYCQKFDIMRDNLRNIGVEEIFIINIGQTKDDYADYTNIRAAFDLLTADAEGNYADEQTSIVSDKFYGATAYMKDRWHYKQHAYNVVGADSGLHIADYYKNIPFTCEQWSGSEGEYNEQNNYGDASDYEYTISGSNIILNRYIGTNTEVYVYPYYMANGEIYKTKFVFADSKISTFNGNTTITQVTFDDDIEPAIVNGKTYLNGMFTGCSSLTNVINLPSAQNITSIFKGTAITVSPEIDLTNVESMSSVYSNCTLLTTPPVIPLGITNMYSTFSGCSSLTVAPEIPEGVTTLQYCFDNCPISSIPDIPNSVTNISIMAANANTKTTLTSVGTIGTGVINMSKAFRYCNNLSGTVRIESEKVSNMSDAFSATAIPNITFEVPANSTTYNTLMAEYPSANVITF